MPARPNPVRDMTNICFVLPSPGIYYIDIFNSAGQRVRHFTGSGQAGVNNATLSLGRLAGGAYLYRLSSDGKKRFGQVVGDKMTFRDKLEAIAHA